MEILEKIVKTQKDIGEWYQSRQVLGIHDNVVHLFDEYFLDTFNDYKTVSLDNEYDKLIAYYDNVCFMALVEKESGLDLIHVEEVAAGVLYMVQNNTITFQYYIDYSEIEDEFNTVFTKDEYSLIADELISMEEIADLYIEEDGFDIVLHINYAPNYEKRNIVT